MIDRRTYYSRKSSGLCPRCAMPASETSVLCERHRRDAVERVERCLARKERMLSRTAQLRFNVTGV